MSTSVAALQPDLRGTPLWRRVEAHYLALHEPGFGRPGEPADPAIAADGETLACTLTVRVDLAGAPRREVLVVRAAGDQRVAVADADVRMPRFAPTGDGLAVLVEPADGSGARPAIVDAGEVRLLPPLPGVTEHLAWSPDGTRLLALVADPGADAAGAQGSGRTGRGALAPWMPVVMADQPVGGWRRLWVHRLGDPGWHVASPPGMNCWEACWAGDGHALVVASSRPEEAAWFDARVDLVDLATVTARTVAVPPGRACIGLPACDPSGRIAAVVTGSCSDRTVVAGEVALIDLVDGDVRHLDLGGVDATWLGFGQGGRLVVAGQRDLTTVVGDVDPATGAYDERWASEELTCGQRYPELGVSAGGVAMVVEGYRHPPELAVLGPGGPRRVTSFAHAGHEAVLADAGRVEAARWTSSDGTEVAGLVVRPAGPGPHPLVVYVHGGPIWAWRARWAMGYPYSLLLARAGYAVLHPNPRGSSGRGEAFRSAVLGDLGGAEVDDLLTGIDHLVATGVADPQRLGVFGGSHGGYIAAWIVTQTDRFRAAVPYCPVTEWTFMRLTTNDAAAQDHLVGAGPARDPLAEVGKVRTPTLVLTGSLDLITPASQGLAFHRALAERGVPTGYVEYPLEGHGVRSFPAQIDFSARVLGWFEHHLDVGQLDTGC